MRKNTPELWDELWEQPKTADEDRYTLSKEEHSIRWKRIEKAILHTFGRIDGLEIIEIGAGSGTYSALLAKRGARATILDYSERALQRSREFFTRHSLPATFLQQDALALPETLYNRFDVSLSFGLMEHFRGPVRRQIAEAHITLLKPGGLTFISVPNKFCPPYRLFKFVAQRTGKWVFGEEYPSSRWELLALAKALDVADPAILAGSLPASFDFVNPFKALAVVRRVLRIRDNLDVTTLRDERGTPLDSIFSYALVLHARKLH